RSESASWIWKKHTHGLSRETCLTRERPFIQCVPEEPFQAARPDEPGSPFSLNSRSSVRGNFVLFEVRPSVILTRNSTFPSSFRYQRSLRRSSSPLVKSQSRIFS